MEVFFLYLSYGEENWGRGGVTKFAHCAYFFACFEISNITETILKVLNKLFKHLFRACFTEWFAQLKS